MNYFILFIVLFQISAFAEPECDYAATSAEVLQLSCDGFEIANAILEKKEVVPSRIYHFGKEEYVQKNVEAKNVPQADWDKYIMGDVTRFDLGYVRRGLYGTGGLDTNNYGQKGYRALMEISIKDECRKPERVVSLEEIEKDSRFQAWFSKKKQPMSMKSFAENCVLDYTKDYENNKCGKIVGEFLKDANIGVIYDHMSRKSFYIRDRNCIENIRGTPSDWIEIFSNTPNLFISRCGDHNKVYMLRALLSNLIQLEEPISPEVLVRLKQNMQLSEGAVRDKLLIALDAKERCDKVEKGKFKNTVESLKAEDTLYIEYKDLCH